MSEGGKEKTAAGAEMISSGEEEEEKNVKNGREWTAMRQKR